MYLPSCGFVPERGRNFTDVRKRRVLARGLQQKMVMHMNRNVIAAQEIAQVLSESNMGLIRAIVETIGIERAQSLLGKALAVEAAGGMMTKDNSRRRSPGGVFFALAREAVTEAQRQELWPMAQRRRRAGRKRVAVKPFPWEDALKLAKALPKAENAGKVTTVKLTLIGRPRKLAQAQSCMACVLEGRSVPKDMPKGLPMPAGEIKQTYVVFIAEGAWKRVASSLKQHVDDELIVEGWPYVDAQRGVIVVLAQGVTTKAIQRAKRQAQQEG